MGIRLLKIILGNCEAVTLTGLEGEAAFSAFDDLAGEGQLEKTVSQTVADLPVQPVDCLLKCRGVAVCRCHIFHALVLKVVDQGLEILDRRGECQWGYRGVIIEEGQ